MGRRRRPGTLTPLEREILSVIEQAPQHAYALGRVLGRDRSSASYTLRRLERMGLVRGVWDTSAARQGPPRRVYSLTAKGRRELAKLA